MLQFQTKCSGKCLLSTWYCTCLFKLWLKLPQMHSYPLSVRTTYCSRSSWRATSDGSNPAHQLLLVTKVFARKNKALDQFYPTQPWNRASVCASSGLLSYTKCIWKQLTSVSFSLILAILLVISYCAKVTLGGLYGIAQVLVDWTGFEGLRLDQDELLSRIILQRSWESFGLEHTGGRRSPSLWLFIR